MNKCPICSYDYVKRQPKKEIILKEIKVGEEIKHSITHNKAEYYNCGNCGYDSRNKKEKKGFFKRWFG